MLYSDVYGKLVLLTKRNDITHAEIGSCINIERGAVFARAKRNSRMKPEEVSALEKHFNIDLSSITETKNSFKINPDSTVSDKASLFHLRLAEIERKTGLKSSSIAEMLGLEEDEYEEYKTGNRKINMRIALAIREHFEISLDWIILGI